MIYTQRNCAITKAVHPTTFVDRWQLPRDVLLSDGQMDRLAWRDDSGACARGFRGRYALGPRHGFMADSCAYSDTARETCRDTDGGGIHWHGDHGSRWHH